MAVRGVVRARNGVGVPHGAGDGAVPAVVGQGVEVGLVDGAVGEVGDERGDGGG